ncbi:MAG: hypothetical protein ACXWRG_11475 [Bdellovibrio sp.]
MASIKPVTHISFNRLSPLSFLNLQKRGYKTHKQVDKSNTPKKAQRSPFDFTRKNAIIYTASFKALQEQASDIEGKKQLRKRLNLEKRLGRLNNKYLRIYGKF